MAVFLPGVALRRVRLPLRTFFWASFPPNFFLVPINFWPPNPLGVRLKVLPPRAKMEVPPAGLLIVFPITGFFRFFVNPPGVIRCVFFYGGDNLISLESYLVGKHPLTLSAGMPK